MDDLQRLLAVFEAVKQQGKKTYSVDNISQFSIKMGLTAPAISQLIKRNGNVSNNIKQKVIDYYKVNPAYIYNGKEPMFKESPPNILNDPETKYIPDNKNKTAKHGESTNKKESLVAEVLQEQVNHYKQMCEIKDEIIEEIRETNSVYSAIIKQHLKLNIIKPKKMRHHE